MRVEQPGLLSEPLMRATRKQVLGTMLALLVFCWVCLLETVFLASWIHNRPVLDAVPGLLVLIAIPLISFLYFRKRVRLAGECKRSIEFTQNGIRFEPCREPCIEWGWTSGLTIEPLEGEADFVKLGIEWRKSKRDRKGSALIAIKRGEQLNQIRADIENARRAGQVIPLLAELDQCSVTTPRVLQMKRWTAVIGLYLLLHGIPLVMIGLGDSSQKPVTAFRREPRPELQAKAKSFEPGLRHVFLVAGGILTTTAVGLCAWGIFRQNDATKSR